MALPENYRDCPKCYSGVYKITSKHKCCQRCVEDAEYREFRKNQMDRKQKWDLRDLCLEDLPEDSIDLDNFINKF